MKNIRSNLNSKQKKASAIVVCVLIVCIFTGFALRKDLMTVTYTVESEKVNGNVRLAVISDLHSSKYGEDQKILIAAIDKADPDIILLTGDIFEETREHDNVKDLLACIGTKYTCFFVTGNHEYRFSSEELGQVKALVRSYGVTVLDGNSHIVTVNGEKIRIAGVNDPAGDGVITLDADGNAVEGTYFTESLQSLSEVANDGIFTVLMSHRPTFFEAYCDLGFDLTVSGHAHGGQVRIPFILNGLYSPDEGLFPKYAGGLYSDDGKAMIVSRGLCRMAFRPRVFNRPELVIVDVK